MLTLDIEFSGCAVEALGPPDVARLQRFLERCPDYSAVVEGDAVSPGAAEETLLDVPPGSTLEQKFVAGLVGSGGEIDGVLEGLRDYPDPGTWWIGLLLLAPETRGRGLGRGLVRDFVDYVGANHGLAVMLGVVEDNHRAFEFWREMGFATVRTTEPRRFGRKTQAVRVMCRDAAIWPRRADSAWLSRHAGDRLR